MGILSLLKESLFGSKVDYQQLIRDGAFVVDVRTPVEYKSGHLQNSLNIPLSALVNRIDELNNKIVILVCKSGVRAEQAKSILGKSGVTAYNDGAWRNLGK